VVDEGQVFESDDIVARVAFKYSVTERVETINPNYASSFTLVPFCSDSDTSRIIWDQYKGVLTLPSQ
jgi:hypothetical protein